MSTYLLRDIFIAFFILRDIFIYPKDYSIVSLELYAISLTNIFPYFLK